MNIAGSIHTPFPIQERQLNHSDPLWPVRKELHSHVRFYH